MCLNYFDYYRLHFKAVSIQALFCAAITDVDEELALIWESYQSKQLPQPTRSFSDHTGVNSQALRVAPVIHSTGTPAAQVVGQSTESQYANVASAVHVNRWVPSTSQSGFVPSAPPLTYDYSGLQSTVSGGTQPTVSSGYGPRRSSLVYQYSEEYSPLETVISAQATSSKTHNSALEVVSDQLAAMRRALLEQ